MNSFYARPVRSLLLLLLFGLTAPAHALELPPEAAAQKRQLETLFAIAPEYGAKYRRQVNSNAQRLVSLTTARDLGTVDGEIDVALPGELASLWGFFRQVQLIGDTHRFEVGWRGNNQTEGKLNHWWKQENINAFKANGFDPEPDVSYTLVLRGQGRVDAVVLNINDQGISGVFDDAPWSVLGADKPVLPVRIGVDATRRRSIEGVTTFEREKYLRLYTAPFGGPMDVHDHFNRRGFLPGRQIFKLGPSLEVGYTDEQPRLTEDPERPGYANPVFFDLDWEWPNARDVMAKRYAGLDYATCLDDWPSFNRHAAPGVPNERGTPADFDAAAELAARTVGLFERRTGSLPRWLEVKNESDISYEWSYHADDAVDGWAELADFHNTVARQVKQSHPEVMVGGPTTAWPAFAHEDWRVGRAHLKFMDDTKGELDFYSHHFYEQAGLLFEDRLADGHGTYMLGKMRSYLDLIRNHQQLTNNEVPLIITEFGSLSGGGADYQLWMQVRNWSAYLTQFMDRPHQFDLCVPFALPLTWWSRESKTPLFVYQADGSWRPGKTAWFLDLWRDYRGTLVPVSSDTEHVNVHAARDGDTLHLVISNLKSQRLAVSLDTQLGDAAVTEALQTRLYLDQGELVFDEVELGTDLTSISVAPEETTILRLKLNRAPEFAGTAYEATYFGDRVLLPTDAIATVNIHCPTADLTSSTLRLGLQHRGGFESPLQVAVNSHELSLDLSASHGIADYDTVVSLKVPTSTIQTLNKIKIEPTQTGGHIATVSLKNVYTSAPE